MAKEIDFSKLSLDSFGSIDDLDLAMMGFGLVAEEEEEALIRQKNHTALDMPVSTLFKSSTPSMN